MTIRPDTKDWTWVLEKPCPECGFDAGSVSVADVPAIVRANALGWESVLQRPDVSRRPDPSVWSPLEYACHVRDVFRLFRERLELMLTQQDPLFANWDQDATALTERYGEQDPSVVAAELAAAGQAVAAAFEAVLPTDHARTGRRSDGATFTVTSFAQYFVHDPVHHLHDVNR